MNWEEIALTEDGVQRTPCDCCGTTTVEVTGDLFLDGAQIAFYTARWTEGHRDVVLLKLWTGDWSEEGVPSDRYAMRVEWRAEGCRLMEADEADRAAHRTCTLLGREDLIGSDYAETVWAMVDSVAMKDRRLKGLPA